MMRFWVYDDDGKLFRKFNYRDEAKKFLQDGWKLVVQPKQQRVLPTPESHGEARW
jgi:hypothetical protein